MDDTFKSIAYADLVLGEKVIHAMASDVVFGRDWTVKRGSIMFPLSAEQLIRHPDAQLRVTGYQEIVSSELALDFDE